MPTLITVPTNTTMENSGVTILSPARAASPSILPIMMLSESSMRYSIAIAKLAVSTSDVNLFSHNDLLFFIKTP